MGTFLRETRCPPGAGERDGNERIHDGAGPRSRRGPPRRQAARLPPRRARQGSRRRARPGSAGGPRRELSGAAVRAGYGLRNGAGAHALPAARRSGRAAARGGRRSGRALVAAAAACRGLPGAPPSRAGRCRLQPAHRGLRAQERRRGEAVAVGGALCASRLPCALRALGGLLDRPQPSLSNRALRRRDVPNAHGVGLARGAARHARPPAAAAALGRDARCAPRARRARCLAPPHRPRPAPLGELGGAPGARGSRHGLHFVALRTAEEFIREAAAMDNCLDQFADRLEQGSSRVFSIRKNGRSVADLEIGAHDEEPSMPAVRQLRGPRNRRARPQLWQAAYAWLGAQDVRRHLPPPRSAPTRRARALLPSRSGSPTSTPSRMPRPSVRSARSCSRRAVKLAGSNPTRPRPHAGAAGRRRRSCASGRCRGAEPPAAL